MSDCWNHYVKEHFNQKQSVYHCVFIYNNYTSPKALSSHFFSSAPQIIRPFILYVVMLVFWSSLHIQTYCFVLFCFSLYYYIVSPLREEQHLPGWAMHLRASTGCAIN